MTKSKFTQQFLKYSVKFQNVDGALDFSLLGIDWRFDSTYSGRILLWADGSELVAWSEDWDYATMAEFAYTYATNNELETA